MLKIIKPGLTSTIQDLGRPGYYNVGIPITGGMDQYALRMANLLVNNPENAAVIECALLGPVMEIQTDTVMAVTGARATPKINDQEMPLDESFNVKKGDILSFDFVREGARIYIAVAGGIDVPLVLGSRSTYPIGAFGGYHGRPLKAGDELAILPPEQKAVAGKKVPQDLIRRAPKEQQLRVLPGLYNYRLKPESEEAFYADTWTVGTEADRMGYRFSGGRHLQFKDRTPPFGAGSDPSNIVDAGYPYGSIQVPGGQEPIILHRDAVSGGGYAQIGTVISADMDLVGQMQPNYKARFVKVTMDEALAARQERQQQLDRLRQLLKDT